MATEHWPIATGITQVGMSYLGFPSGSYETASVEMDGLNQSHYHDITLKEEQGADNIARIDFKTDRAIAWRESGTETRSGWPSKRLKFHRMFEGRVMAKSIKTAVKNIFTLILKTIRADRAATIFR